MPCATLIQGTTTIVISHDPALVRCADRVLRIAAGSIAEDDVPATPSDAVLPDLPEGSRRRSTAARRRRSSGRRAARACGG